MLFHNKNTCQKAGWASKGLKTFASLLSVYKSQSSTTLKHIEFITSWFLWNYIEKKHWMKRLISVINLTQEITVKLKVCNPCRKCPKQVCWIPYTSIHLRCTEIFGCRIFLITHTQHIQRFPEYQLLKLFWSLNWISSIFPAPSIHFQGLYIILLISDKETLIRFMVFVS